VHGAGRGLTTARGAGAENALQINHLAAPLADLPPLGARNASHSHLRAILIWALTH
jgi:hypothetical protein